MIVDEPHEDAYGEEAGMKITRRSLLAAGALSPLGANPLGLPIGCQTYPLRQALGKDFDGTLRQLAAIGFRRIEMCSPPGYARSGYGPLVGMKAREMRDRIQAAGLGCQSCHYQFGEFKESLDERVEFARELGLKQMVLSTFSMPKAATLADWARAAGELNRIAERIHRAGLATAFHNHNVEFTQLEGSLIYDKLLAELDPKLVKMQFQVFVTSLGVDAAALFQKHPGRFLSLHLQDWSAASKAMAAIGEGSVNWKKLFAAARKAGVKNYFVEMDLELMKASVPYLQGLQG
jgi:sugar phosphate isomerase/epimerase